MFKSLIAKDFKRHENLQMAFEPGLTLLVGPNYTGKSSVLQAILYAFGGPTAVPGGNEVITRKGAKQADVSVEFSVNGDDYLLRRAGNKVNLSKNGDFVAKSSAAVASYLEDLTGLTKDRFLQLKHGAQKETEALLTLGVAKLHGIIEEVSGAQMVGEVITKASSALTQAKGGLAALPEADLEQAEQTELALRNGLLTLNGEISQLKIEAEKRDLEWRACTRQYREAQEHNAEGERIIREFNTLQKDKQKWMGAQATAALTLEETPDQKATLEAAKTTWDKAVHEAARLESEDRRLAGVNQSVETLKSRVSATEVMVSKYKETLENAPKPVDPLVQQEAFNKSNAEFQSAKHQLAKIQGALKDGICPTCMRPFEGYDLHSLETERRELEEQVVEYGKTNNKEKELLEKIHKNNKLYDEIAQKLTSQQSTLEAQKEDLAQASKELEPLAGTNTEQAMATAKAKAIEAKRDYDRLYKQQIDREAAEKSFQACKEFLSEVEEKLAAFEEFPKLTPLDPLRQAEEEALEVFLAFSGDLKSKEGEYAGRYDEWLAAKEQVSKAQKLENKRVDLEKRAAGIDELIRYLRKNRDRFLSTIWQGLMGYASDFATTCTDGAIERLVRNDNGTFSYVEQGQTHPIKAASGAQRSIMGLGVQLALAQMLPSPLSVLLLDEPTADLDPERSLAMASILSAESNQVIMVSHRELDGAVAAEVYDMETLT